jgi:hypothetical protein
MPIDSEIASAVIEARLAATGGAPGLEWERGLVD